jgi:hypothetical protein
LFGPELPIKIKGIISKIFGENVPLDEKLRQKGSFIEVGLSPGGTLIHNDPLENPKKIHGGVGLLH